MRFLILISTIISLLLLTTSAEARHSHRHAVSKVRHIKPHDSMEKLILTTEAQDVTDDSDTSANDSNKAKISKLSRKQKHGVASWYGRNHHGRKTASGSRFNMYGLTAAHKSYPFGTKLEIINVDNDKKVIVTVTDRGPYVGNRVLDLSKGAADKLGMLKTGTATIAYRVVN